MLSTFGIIAIVLWAAGVVTGALLFRGDLFDPYFTQREKLWLVAGIIGWPLTFCWIIYSLLTDNDKLS